MVTFTGRVSIPRFTYMSHRNSSSNPPFWVNFEVVRSTCGKTKKITTADTRNQYIGWMQGHWNRPRQISWLMQKGFLLPSMVCEVRISISKIFCLSSFAITKKDVPPKENLDFLIFTLIALFVFFASSGATAELVPPKRPPSSYMSCLELDWPEVLTGNALKSYRAPIGKDRLPTIFSGSMWNFWGCMFFSQEFW